jgi:hypothetical protein
VKAGFISGWFFSIGLTLDLRPPANPTVQTLGLEIRWSVQFDFRRKFNVLQHHIQNGGVCASDLAHKDQTTD